MSFSTVIPFGNFFDFIQWRVICSLYWGCTVLRLIYNIRCLILLTCFDPYCLSNRRTWLQNIGGGGNITGQGIYDQHMCMCENKKKKLILNHSLNTYIKVVSLH